MIRYGDRHRVDREVPALEVVEQGGAVLHDRVAADPVVRLGPERGDLQAQPVPGRADRCRTRLRWSRSPPPSRTGSAAFRPGGRWWRSPGRLRAGRAGRPGPTPRRDGFHVRRRRSACRVRRRPARRASVRRPRGAGHRRGCQPWRRLAYLRRADHRHGKDRGVGIGPGPDKVSAMTWTGGPADSRTSRGSVYGTPVVPEPVPGATPGREVRNHRHLPGGAERRE